MLANLLTYLNVSPATPPEPGMTTSISTPRIPFVLASSSRCHYSSRSSAMRATAASIVINITTYFITPSPFELLLLFSKNDVDEVVEGSGASSPLRVCLQHHVKRIKSSTRALHPARSLGRRSRRSTLRCHDRRFPFTGDKDEDD